MNQKTKEILKAVAIIVFVPTAITVTYYGAKKGFELYTKKKTEGNEKKILDKLSKALKKRNSEKKDSITPQKQTKIEQDWSVELKKMSPKALKTFMDWYMLTVPYGRNHNQNYWAYEDINSDLFEQKKDALGAYITSEIKDGKLITYYDKTKILEYLYDLQLQL